MHLDRRQFLGGVTAALAGLTDAGGRPRRPRNLLLILTDQHRFDALSCAGNGILHTPNIDKLAAAGTMFTDATCAAPLCGPSRAGMLTGRLAFQHGCRGNFKVQRAGGIRPQVATYDEVLRKAGYTCSYHGKWHTGAAHRECYLDGLPEYLDLYRKGLGAAEDPPEGWSGAEYRRDRYTKLVYKSVALDEMMRTAPQRGIPMPHHNEAGLSYLPADKSLTAWTARAAIAFLRGKPRAPFSLTCSILAPHAPLIASAPYFGKFDPKKMPMPENVRDDLPDGAVARCVPAAIKLDADGLGKYIALYYGLVAETDVWVGRLLEALAEAGHTEDTLVVFVGDHGDLMGSHGTVSKMQMFEECWRVPLILRLPGAVPAGKRIDKPATGWDLFPTILDLCGVDDGAKGLAGRSLRGAWTAPDEWPGYAIGEMGRPGAPRHQFAVRGGGFKLVLPARMPPRLYDLGGDPGEQRNLLAAKDRSPAHRRRAATMRAFLAAELERLGDPAAADLPGI